jgi:xanthine/CO dehydrogenase XdhC/CoxF family maturation factor
MVEIAERVIDRGRPELAHFGIADQEAWGVGSPCGGEIDVWIQGYEPGPFERAARACERAAEVTLLELGARSHDRDSALCPARSTSTASSRPDRRKLAAVRAELGRRGSL